MKKIILSLLLLATCLGNTTVAQTMTDMWLTIPQSIIGPISKNERLDLTDLYLFGAEAHIASPMGDTIKLTTLQPTYMQLRTSKASTIQVKMIATGKKDHLFVVIKTIEGPIANSHIKIYNSQWEELPADNHLTLPTVATFFHNNTPPTEQQLHQVKLPCIQYTMCDNNNDIIATATFLSALDINTRPSFEELCSRNLILEWRGKKWKKPLPTTLPDEQ